MHVAKIFAQDANISIGILSPYKEQIYLIREAALVCSKAIEVQSIDAFQGREKDVILFSCVRDGASARGVGFLADERRLNVAITRARRALWIIGNVNHLRTYGGPVLGGLIRYCDRLDRIFDVGSIPGIPNTMRTGEPRTIPYSKRK